MDSIRTAATTAPGITTAALRDAIESRAARDAGGRRLPTDELIIPEDLSGFLAKVSARPYEITDEDIEQLKANGYTEDAIYEITVCAALGEGLARLERTLDLLEGAPPCD